MCDFKENGTKEREKEWKEKIEKAEHAVRVAVGTTATTGAIPIPFADMPVLIAQQVALMATISGIFEMDIKKDGLKGFVMAVLGVGGAALVGKTVAANLIKWIPVAGSLAGGAISAGTAGTITWAMGEAYIEVCKAVKMGKLNEEDIGKEKGIGFFKDAFQAQIKYRE